MQKISKQTRMVYPALIALCVSCTIAMPVCVNAAIVGVEVVPSNPTVNDSVTITVSGSFSDGCWHPGQGQCGSVEGFLIRPSIHALDVWQPGVDCPMMIVDYSFICEYGTLKAGHYFVKVTEEHKSLREPSPELLSVEFDVVIPPAIKATVDVDPQTLNRRSKGRYITCYVELPAGYDPEDIDVHTMLLNDRVRALLSPTDVDDHDHDGIPDRMIKFQRSEVIALFDGADVADFDVTISGELKDGTPFAGTDVIRVINPGRD